MASELQVGKWASAPHLTNLDELFAYMEPGLAGLAEVAEEPPPGWPEGMALPPWWSQLVEVFPVETAWPEQCQGCGFPVLVLAKVDPEEAPFAGRAWFCPQCGRDPSYELAQCGRAS